MSLARMAALVGGLVLAGLAIALAWSGTAAADEYLPPADDCLWCHSAGRLAPQVTPKAQRTWQQEQGTGLGEWSKGQDDRAFTRTDILDTPASPSVPLSDMRGVHGQADLSSCSDCHRPNIASEEEWCESCHAAAEGRAPWRHAWKPNSPTYPPGTNLLSGNCAANCHAWVPAGATVTAQGFVNALANPSTTYSGPIQPGTLIENTTKLHGTEVFANEGCAGSCHGGADGPNPNAKHGTITLCKECHIYPVADTVADPANNMPVMHTTHASLVGGEQTLADPENAGKGGCIYCHDRENLPGRASCWNCHLSAHDPQVPYWKLPSPGIQ